MALLAPDVLQRVNRQVYRRFPAVDGVKPSVRRAGHNDLVRLTYTTRAQTADGFTLTQRVQVLVRPEDGKIVKMTTVR